RADGAILDEDAVMILSAYEAHARKQARRVAAIGIGKRGTRTNGPGGRVDLIVDEVEFSGVWVAVLVNEPDIDVGVAMCARLMLRLRVTQISLLIGVEIDVNRIIRNECGQKIGTGHQVPGSDDRARYVTVDWRAHFGELAIQPRFLQGGVDRAQGSLG